MWKKYKEKKNFKGSPPPLKKFESFFFLVFLASLRGKKVPPGGETPLPFLGGDVFKKPGELPQRLPFLKRKGGGRIFFEKKDPNFRLVIIEILECFKAEKNIIYFFNRSWVFFWKWLWGFSPSTKIFFFIWVFLSCATIPIIWVITKSF